MFWDNHQRRSSSNMFFWGAISGIVGGVYLNRWMKHEHHRDFNAPSASQKHSSSTSGTENNVNESNKDELFETFIHGSEQELKRKASDLDLEN